MRHMTPWTIGFLALSFVGPFACDGGDAAAQAKTEDIATQSPPNHPTNQSTESATNTPLNPTSSSQQSTSNAGDQQTGPGDDSTEAVPTQDPSTQPDNTDSSGDASSAAGSESASARLQLGAGSTVQWAGNKADGSGHVGGFETIDGHAVIRGQQLERLVVKIDMTSITSDNAKLTSHLKNDDFFSVDQFPEASFFSNSINNNATMTGELAIKGKAHEVSGPVNVEWTGDGVRVQATWKIDRTRWGVDYKSSVTGIVADKAINDEVPLTIDLNFVANGG